MNTRSFFAAVALILVGLAAGWYFASQHARSEHVAHSAAEHASAVSGPTKTRIYQCPMHPWIRSDKPGTKCTICGMELVAASDSANQEMPPGVIPLSASTVTVLGVKTVAVAMRPLERTLRVAGTIDDDDSRHRILSAYVAGRVEQLHVNFIGAEVRAGQPLLTLYSQSLLNTEREYIRLIRTGEATYQSTAPARDRLRGMGLVDEQIERLIATGEPEQFTTFVSPVSGTILVRGVYPGQNVAAGDKLFEIGDFSSMWFLFEAYEQDLPWIHVGQKVDVKTRAVPGKTFSAAISFIDPTFNETTRSTRVRVELKNELIGEGPAARREIPHRVFAEGVVHVNIPEVLAIPRTAVLDPGTGPVAYVDLGGNAYEQRLLKLGQVGDSWVEVVEGVREGEAVVTEGNLLVDAQAQLSREAAGYAHEPPRSGTAAAVSTGPLHNEPGKKEAAAPPAVPQAMAEPKERLGALVEAAAKGADALASDDFARYAKVFPELEAASQGLTLPKLAVGQDLASARRSFEVWSTAAADLVLPHREHLGARVFQCPMAPVLKRGRWIQKTDELKNPFFGSAMLECGVELK